jgi:DNA replication protein DnaC
LSASTSSQTPAPPKGPSKGAADGLPLTPKTRPTKPIFAHPGVNKGCPRCQGAAYIVTRHGERAVAQLCPCVGTCPKCTGTGWTTDTETKRLVRCRCQRFLGRIASFNEAMIPARHADSTLANFEPSQASHLPLRQALLDRVRQWEAGKANRGFVLWGEVGRGKTHLMVGVLRELIFEHGITARFIEFSHLLADLKAGFDRGQGPGSLIDPLVRVDVLAVDEMGKGRNTEFEGTVLDELISRRYNALGPILGTTNYTPGPATGHAVANAAMPDASRPALSDRVSERVYSRLVEMVDFIHLDGEDYRERLAVRANPGVGRARASSGATRGRSG